MKERKEIKLRINKMYLYWFYVYFVRKYSIFLFTQNLSLDAKSDLSMQLELLDNQAECKIIKLDKNMIRKFFKSKKNSGCGWKNWKKIKDFKCLIGLKNVEDILKIEKILKEYNILIKGYYIQNVFFSKQDWNVKKIEKKNVIENLKQRLNIFYILFIRLILLLKKKEYIIN